MKMWTSPKLVWKRGYYSTWLETPQRRKVWFCGEWLRRYFAWPASAKLFWLTLSVQPLPGGLLVEAKRSPDTAGRHWGRGLGRHRWCGMHAAFNQAIAKHFGSRLTSGPLYLGVLYEE